MNLRFSICIETIFQELPLEARVENVSTAGFGGIEIWDWRNKDLDSLASQCADLGLAITNMSGQRAGE